MRKQKMGNQELTLKQKTGNHELTLKRKRISKLQKQKKQILQKLKTLKVRYDLEKEDSSENSFSNIPIVRQEKSFKNITSDYIIDNIKENNIFYYFKTIRESVKKTISNFKGNETIKFKLIITCEFKSPLAFDIRETHFNRPFEELLTMNNFDDIYSNIQEDFIAWLDGYEGRGYGYVFDKIIKTNIRLSKTNYLRASSYFYHDLGL